jgi:hypothetical protein
MLPAESITELGWRAAHLSRTTSIRLLALLTVALVSIGCVTVGPVASGATPSVPPSGATLAPIPTGVTTPRPSGTPLVTLPPTDAPTLPPTATPTTAPTETATTAPTESPTTAPTDTASPTDGATPAPTLNFSLPAIYGSTALTAGFVPDPFTIAVQGGGPAGAEYIEDDVCRGFTTVEPTFSVQYTSGSPTLLRFYFIPDGPGDPTMIVNGPSSTYSCGDDSNDTFNPMVDFDTPASGRYDIWVGTYAPGTTLAGTLYVTELVTNGT